MISPARRGSAWSQKTRAVKVRASWGRSLDGAPIWPRSTKSSSSSVTATDCSGPPGPWPGGSAAGQVSIDFTRLRLPPG